MLIAAVAMFDSRRTALPDPSGTAPGGLGPGFYPFWAAALMFVAGIGVVYRAIRLPQSAEGVFRDRRSITSVLALIVPIVVATSLLKWLGFYLMTALYMGYFTLVIGRYRWFWILAIAFLLPAAVYGAFEIGFRIPLPKSVFY